VLLLLLLFELQYFRYTFYFYLLRDYILITCILICFVVDLSLHLNN